MVKPVSAIARIRISPAQRASSSPSCCRYWLQLCTRGDYGGESCQTRKLSCISRWKVEGWCGANGKSVPNRDLWEELLALTTEHQIQWTWVRGHTGNNKDQERADRLACAAGRQQAEAAHA